MLLTKEREKPFDLRAWRDVNLFTPMEELKWTRTADSIKNDPRSQPHYTRLKGLGEEQLVKERDIHLRNALFWRNRYEDGYDTGEFGDPQVEVKMFFDLAMAHLVTEEIAQRQRSQSAPSVSL